MSLLRRIYPANSNSFIAALYVIGAYSRNAFARKKPGAERMPSEVAGPFSEHHAEIKEVTLGGQLIICCV